VIIFFQNITPLIEKVNKLQSSDYRNECTCPIGAGRGSHGICGAHFGNRCNSWLFFLSPSCDKIRLRDWQLLFIVIMVGVKEFLCYYQSTLFFSVACAPLIDLMCQIN
jgi:hypothetical protein